MTYERNKQNDYSKYYAAMAKGYTQRVLIDAGDSEILALVKPYTELDSCFKAYDVEECEYLAINGWNCTFDMGESC